jgi:glycerol uptake facilitator-like aquaporin
MNSSLISLSVWCSGKHDQLGSIIQSLHLSYPHLCRGIIDYSNVFTTPSTVPLLVGLAFGVSVWCFGPATAALNPARDLGEYEQ